MSRKVTFWARAVEPYWTNAFVVTLPKTVMPTPHEDDEAIMDWLAQKQEFTARELETYLNKSKATVRKIIEELLHTRQIIRVGSGPQTRYQVIQ